MRFVCYIIVHSSILASADGRCVASPVSRESTRPPRRKRRRSQRESTIPPKKSYVCSRAITSEKGIRIVRHPRLNKNATNSRFCQRSRRIITHGPSFSIDWGPLFLSGSAVFPAVRVRQFFRFSSTFRHPIQRTRRLRNRSFGAISPFSPIIPRALRRSARSSARNNARRSSSRPHGTMALGARLPATRRSLLKRQQILVDPNCPQS
jgi:hypothetical protein